MVINHHEPVDTFSYSNGFLVILSRNYPPACGMIQSGKGMDNLTKGTIPIK